MCAGRANVNAFVEAVGSERMVFGGLFYSHPASYDHCLTLEDIKAANIGDADKANILAGNATRLFQLD